MKVLGSIVLAVFVGACVLAWDRRSEIIQIYENRYFFNNDPMAMTSCKTVINAKGDKIATYVTWSAKKIISYFGDDGSASTDFGKMSLLFGTGTGIITYCSFNTDKSLGDATKALANEMKSDMSKGN